MSLILHRAVRADRLAHALGDLLRTPLGDPFATEIIAVPTQGVERWLAQSLSHQLGTSPDGRDGVCAGVQFPSPRRLAAAAVAAASGVDVASDPWSPARLVWPLLDVIDSVRGQTWSSLLWCYLGDAGSPDQAPTAGPAAPDPTPSVDAVRRGRRWATASKLADLYAHYASSRPQMILQWMRGYDVDGLGQPLTADYRWQAELWRRLRETVDAASPAERDDAACARLVEEPQLSDLPDRISVFGTTRLSAGVRSVLAALAEHREVHLWLAHPSPALWRRVARVELPPGAMLRSEDPTAELPANPLLGYLGRDSRELQLTLRAATAGAARHVDPSQDLDDPDDVQGQVPHPATLLHRLQADLAHDRAVQPEADRPLLDPGDRSVAVHVSHGPDRQVEVLREVLVGLLADEPTLEPRDIVVMCPDIETFAPLISATFGLSADDPSVEHPGHRLRVRLADRALRQVNPLLSALSRVLALTDSRMEASTLLDLCATAPVARKFTFSNDEIERLTDLVHRSGIRWGLDVEHRQGFAMGQFGQNTWAAGVERLLLGVTMDENGQQFIGTALPLDDVDSSDADLVGRLAELIERVRELLGQFAVPRPAADWVQLCRHTLELLTAAAPGEEWQMTHAYAQLAALADGVRDHSQAPLSVADMRALLADTFRGRATRANFRTGTLTMCTLMPMRSVPHRVVVLLGLDDGVFPRHNSRNGDDILAAAPEVGDRDPRSEDRQLLLDAVLAAQERLVLIYSGRDARTRAVKPPAVPVGALLDALDVTARCEDGGLVRDQVTTAHPLQPHDRVNFAPGPVTATGQRAFSFDASSMRGALAADGPREPTGDRYDTHSLTPFPLPDVVALTDLVAFVVHPLRALLRARAGLRPTGREDAPDEQIPVELSSLAAWAVGDRMLRLHLDGADVERLTAAEWRRGSLPPRAFGSRAIGPVVDTVRQIAATATPFLTEPRSGADVLADLGQHTVAGTLSAVYGDRLVSVTYSWLGAKHRLRAWVELLALTVTQPDRPWQAVTIGRGHSSLLGPVPGPWATRVLADLVDLNRVGLGEPLPLGPKTASEYARLRYEGKSIAVFADKLEKLWAEERDDAYQRLLGPDSTFADQLRRPSLSVEERGSLAEPSRFGSLARRVWHPLLDSEVLL